MQSSLRVTREEMQKLDQYAINVIGIPSLVLMENAGRSMADFIISKKPKNVICVIGKGNNGGDGLVIARYLHKNNIPVQVILSFSPEEASSDLLVQFKIIRSLKIPFVSFEDDDVCNMISSADMVVDALFGVGLTRIIEDPYSKMISLINNSPAKVLSVDIPSGLDANTGEELGISVRADETLTCGFEKLGFSLKQGPARTGAVSIIDFGLPTGIESIL